MDSVRRISGDSTETRHLADGLPWPMKGWPLGKQGSRKATVCPPSTQLTDFYPVWRVQSRRRRDERLEHRRRCKVMERSTALLRPDLLPMTMPLAKTEQRYTTVLALSGLLKCRKGA